MHVRGQETVGKDAYQDFSKRYGKPFDNLADSQSTLVSTVTGMMKRYAVPDPMSSAAPGHFPDPALQQRYDTLIRSGTSASAAVTAMEGYERQNSSDLQRILSHTSQPDLQQMYTHLKQAADRHLGTLQQHH
ncbi:DUF2202 domain-containing protein [Streptomyces silvisoli]|uniref:DUF2202 domain-containing protein n=1 Tax=Streptomyces silvisoli TaxID=3034235 RepID=A0ABT5ZNZ2_9ACTN|nr:DUF2202 domain-containing protein [Streptomyces silvisoli]MDF3291541.1 DUF2202 domain-containing protein [Streptomyces silvisoli]